MDWQFSLLGFLVGLMVGLTGIGGAAVMTPLLILVGGVRPVIAVGTDLLYGAITKAAGALFHWRHQTVDLPVVKRLGIGSIPMALVGVALISWMKGGSDNGSLDRFVTRALALVLIVAAVSLLLRPLHGRGARAATSSEYSRRRAVLTVVLGAAIGLLVGLTSVGSGSLIAAALVTLYPQMPLRRVVGTDIFHAAFLTVAAGLAHLSLGHVDVPLLGRLLIGSIPGIWLGTRLAITVPDKVLRPILASILLGIGYKLI